MIALGKQINANKYIVHESREWDVCSAKCLRCFVKKVWIVFASNMCTVASSGWCLVRLQAR